MPNGVPESARNLRMSAEYEILVIGAGPAGLAAATVAAEAGKRVALCDDTPWLGGQIWRGEDTTPRNSQARAWLARFRRSGATLLAQTAVIAAPRTGNLLAETPTGPRELHWQKLILATGARELFLPFPGWTLPGMMGPGGLQALMKHGWPVRGERVVVAGSGPLLLAVAAGLRSHGSQIVSVAEQAPFGQVAAFGRTLLSHPAKVLQSAQIMLRLLGVPYRCGVWPVRAEGKDRVEQVTLTDGQRTWTQSCTVLACGFGLVPNVELPLLLGCELRDGFVHVNDLQATSVAGVYCAGEPTGIGGADCALVEGQIAGLAAAGGTVKPDLPNLQAQRAKWHRFRAALQAAFALRPEVKHLADDATLVCRCEDVLHGQLRIFRDGRDAKLQSRCGMGPCQGRICGAAAKELYGWGIESVRPPILAARVESLISEPTDAKSPTCNSPANH
jgi:NADPH-dependent 2,4-dienoyl-CoA reductase/sulfur reductase-like enzyme